MRTIAVAMQKGGVGKTTTAIHVAAALAEMGKRVLLVDVDPQSQCAHLFGADVDPQRTVYALMMGDAALDVVTLPVRERLGLVPGCKKWLTADLELYPLMDGRLRLRRGLEREKAAKLYDFVIVDTPPNLGSLTVNALVAADEVLVPVKAAQADVDQLPTFLSTVEQVRAHLNGSLRVLGLLPTQYDQRRAADVALVEILQRNPQGLRCFAPIPYRARLQETFARHAPVFETEREAGWQYERLAEEISDGN